MSRYVRFCGAGAAGGFMTVGHPYANQSLIKSSHFRPLEIISDLQNISARLAIWSQTSIRLTLSDDIIVLDTTTIQFSRMKETSLTQKIYDRTSPDGYRPPNADLVDSINRTF